MKSKHTTENNDKPSEEKSEAVRSEIQEYLDFRNQRRWVFPKAALVGAIAGLVALFFRIALAGADSLRSNLINWAHANAEWGWIFPVLYTMAGAILSVFITRRFAPEAKGSGIPHLEAVLHRISELNWKRVLPVKFFGGIIAIGSGLALGREGPTVQMGGAIGDAISRFLKVSERERLTLISAGAGAGLAAAFNAPLSGLIFVLEEVRRDFQPIVFGAAFVAAVIADIIARLGSGQFPVFIIPSYSVPPLASLPIFAILGLIAGFLGVFFNRTILFSINLFSNIPRKFFPFVVAITGGFVGLVGWFSPILLGSGHTLAETAMKNEVLLASIPLFFIIRLILTTTNYGIGAPGGIFAPLLVLGSLIGLAIGQIAHNYVPNAVPVPAVFAVVGMAAYFAAIVRAPLTGIMLIVEMTGNYSLMLPLLVSCFCAYAVAEYTKDLPIYEALLERDLQLNNKVHLIKEPIVMDFIVEDGSPFSGQFIRSLGLQPGCILVRCSDGKREWVPTANTRLDAHLHITAVISPDAQTSIELLRIGCKKSTAY